MTRSGFPWSPFTPRRSIDGGGGGGEVSGVGGGGVGGGGGGGGEAAGRGGEEEEALRARGVPGAAGLPAGQRVHPPALPLRVAAPAGAALRLLHPQRDPQRLDVRDPSLPHSLPSPPSRFSCCLLQYSN